MPQLGLVTIDGGGIILDHDVAFGRAMRAAPDGLVGCNAIDITAPADRERCTLLIGQVLRNGGSVDTVKRLIRRDGSHLWVHNTMTLQPPVDDSRRIAIVVDESAPPAGWKAPDILLQIAKQIYAARRLRAQAFTSSLFIDPAWDVLIAAYVHEAEGRVLTTGDLQVELGLNLAHATRWMRALTVEGLIEYEDAEASLPAASFRLTADAHARFERYLSEAYIALTPADTARVVL